MFIYISAMSKNQKSIYDNLSNAFDQIIIHICKIMMYPSSPAVNHWKHEIWSFLFHVSKEKKSKRWPSSKFIYEAISEENDNLDAFIQYAIQDEEIDPEIQIDEEELLSMLIQYQEWLSDNLSKYGYVSNRDVYSKIDELLRNTH